MVVARPDAPVSRPAPIVFFGTPVFAVPTFLALMADARFAVRLVVTQPPRPAGRGQTVQRSAVHEAADAHGIPVITPERLRGTDAVTPIAAAQPALFVVAAYGKILRPEMLAMPDHGTLNVHASLLPAYRGASPIHAAILDGVPETGVTIMLMSVGLDTGPILAQARVPVASAATTAQLTDELAHVGAPLLVDAAAHWLQGAITPYPQDDTQATMTRLIVKEDGIVDWAVPAARIARMERAYQPWPGVATYLGERRLILHALSTRAASSDALPGTILAVEDGALLVRAGDGVVVVGAIQPEGKAAMPARAFANGRPHLIGSRFQSIPPSTTRKMQTDVR